jgi:hypothetical protein
MTNQEKQKLNEKLARWIGNISHDWTDEVCGYKTTECFCKNCHRAEDYTPFPCIPDFTDSLDACFQWLVPKAIKFIQDKNVWNYQQSRRLLFDCWLSLLNEDDYALALCLAIEKLIEVME